MFLFILTDTVIAFQPDAFPDSLAHAPSDCAADVSAITKPYCGSDGRADCSALGRPDAEVRAAIRMVC